MSDLETKLKYYADNYYIGNELVSDEEYDALVSELKKQNPESDFFKDINGDDLKGISKKIKLPQTMGTLQKFHTKEEFSKWFDARKGIELIVEGKVDGNGQLLIYEDGKFVQSISRGNGDYGEDTTANVSKVQGVIKEITGFSGEIRGEIVLKDSVFDTYFKGESNPRNSAAGRIKQKDGKDCEKLNFIAYDVWERKGYPTVSTSELEKLEFLGDAGFETPVWWAGASLEDIYTHRDNLDNLRKEVDYGMDGLVIKYNKTDKNDLKRHIPTTQVAFKPEAQIKASKLRKIIWQLAGSQFAPVAVIDPIEIDGAMVERASLSNIDIMNKLGVYEGADVFVKRSGMVIPQLVKVLEPKRNSFEIPEVCPYCGSKIVLSENKLFPICPNPECDKKLNHRFVKLFDILGIKGTGEAFIDNMVNEVESVKQFFDYCIEENEIVDKWAGGINGRKIIKQMKKAFATPISTAKFLATFDYHGFDEKKLKLLDFNLDEMYTLTVEQIIRIDGFADKTASLFLSFMKEKKDEIEVLRHYFVIEDEKKQTGGKLSGLSFCFTGAACKPRNELQAIVEANGGTVKSGVSKGLSYLVTDDVASGSSKNVKAAQLGIPVISSIAFLKMIK